MNTEQRKAIALTVIEAIMEDEQFFEMMYELVAEAMPAHDEDDDDAHDAHLDQLDDEVGQIASLITDAFQPSAEKQS